MLNLPPVHGYGIPQILSQWQAGQNRRQQRDQFKQEFDLREKQFEQQTEMNKAELENKKLFRTGVAIDNIIKKNSIADKLWEDKPEMAKTLFSNLTTDLNRLFGTNINTSSISNQKEANDLIKNVALDKVYELHGKAVADPTSYNIGLFDAAKSKVLGLKGIDKDQFIGLKVEQAKTPKPGEGQATLGENQIRIDDTGKTIATGPKKDTIPKGLESLKSDYMQTMGRYWSAKRGEGQFIEDPNAQQVAKEALKAAVVMAGQYKDMGGNIKDLGIDEAALEGKDTQEEMAEMPSPTDHKGKTLRDTKTNKRFRSDGKKWIEIK